jgi:hypothetical protein
LTTSEKSISIRYAILVYQDQWKHNLITKTYKKQKGINQMSYLGLSQKTYRTWRISVRILKFQTIDKHVKLIIGLKVNTLLLPIFSGPAFVGSGLFIEELRTEWNIFLYFSGSKEARPNNCFQFLKRTKIKCLFLGLQNE